MKTTDTKPLFPRPSKPRYKQQYGVIVLCRDEADQARIYARLQRRCAGREIKVVVT